MLFPARHCLRPSQNPHRPGSHELLDPVLAQEFFHRIDLFRIPDDLEDERLGPHVNDLDPKDGGDLHRF